jgi:hypothetical protein
MGDFGNGVEQFSEHFQVRCRVSLLIGYSTDFIRAAPILADSIDSFAPGQKRKSGPALGSRNQARWLPTDGARNASRATAYDWADRFPRWSG